MRKTCHWVYADNKGLHQPAHYDSHSQAHSLLKESLNTTECMNGEQRPGPYFTHAQDDLNLCMFKGTFFA